MCLFGGGVLYSSLIFCVSVCPGDGKEAKNRGELQVGAQ